MRKSWTGHPIRTSMLAFSRPAPASTGKSLRKASRLSPEVRLTHLTQHIRESDTICFAVYRVQLIDLITMERRKGKNCLTLVVSMRELIHSCWKSKVKKSETGLPA